MSKLERLIQQYCPDGVEWKTLGELGSFYSGLSGKTKSDFTGGNEKFITYVNIFNNPSLKTDVPERVKIAEGEKQNTIQYGDILFTGSSETPDECGMSSVLTHTTEEKLYLNSFCFGFRFFDLSDKDPSFMKYLFRSTNIRKTICKTANGVTRYNISKKEFAKIEIPIIPLPVQTEIARILDAFTELQAELQKRKQQYNFYRDTLLSFEEKTDVEWKKLGNVAFYVKNRVDSSSITISNYVSVENLLQNRQGKTIASNVPDGSLIHYEPGDILIGNIRPYLKKIWLADGSGGTNGDVLTIRADRKFLTPEFLYQCLASDDFFQYDMNHAKGAKMPRGSKDDVLNYKIPIPPLEEQNRIVAILDRFDTLTNDLTSGLPAEMEKRRLQYEYYRDRLLTFKRL